MYGRSITYTDDAWSVGRREHAPDGTERAPRGGWRLLVTRDFGGFFWGKLVSASGLYLHTLVAGLVVFGATGSTVAVGLVAAAQFAPQLLLAPVAGAWADRGRVGPQIVVGRVLCALGSGALAVWWWSGAGPATGWGAAWPVIAASLVVGLGLVVGGPAMQSVPPLLVARADLPTAMALNTAPMTVGRIAGPAGGAVLVTALGDAPALVVAAAGHGVFALAMAVVRVPRVEVGPEPAGRGLTAGLQRIRADRPLALLLLAVAAVGFGSEPIMTLAPTIGERLGGVTAVGALTSGFGCGAAAGIVLGAVLARRARHEVVTPLALGGMALGVAACGVAPTVPLVVAAAVTAGTAFILASSSTGTLIQLRTPADVRGRVMAVWMMGFVGSRPLSALLTGGLADRFTPAAACLVVASVLVVVGLVCRPAALR